MIDHVQDIPYVRGSTNTGLALEEMREKIFVPKAGDRPNVPDLAIVILDGNRICFIFFYNLYCLLPDCMRYVFKLYAHIFVN